MELDVVYVCGFFCVSFTLHKLNYAIGLSKYIFTYVSRITITLLFCSRNNGSDLFLSRSYISYILSHFSRVQLFLTPWTVGHQAPLFTGFFRQEHWSGLLGPPPEDRPGPGIKPYPVSYTSWIGRRVLYHWCHLGRPFKGLRGDFASHLIQVACLCSDSW